MAATQAGIVTILDRYIFKTVVITTLVALLVLLVLDIFFNLLNELEDVGKGSYGLAQVIQFLLLTSPRRIYEALPMALLVGGLLGMGALANSSELTVMRAAGISVLRLVGSALQAGLILSLLGLLLGEFISPFSERLAQDLRTLSRDIDAPLRASGSGFWIRDGQNFVSIGVIFPDNRIAGIGIYTLNDNAELTTVTRAHAARYETDHWILENVTRIRVSNEAIATETQPQLAWQSTIDPGALNVLASDPEDLAMRELLTYIDYLRTNHLDTRHYQLAFWTKVIGPLTNLAMLFIALPFVFGSQRSIGTGQRLLIGVLLGLAFYLLNRMLTSWVLLTGMQPIFGAILPTALFFLAGTLALRRMG
jgi:lipopolysaccharide export system permease protein